MAPMRVGRAVYPAAARSKVPPNPPMAASAPGRAVDLTSELIRLTRSLPADMDTPADAYVRGVDRSFGSLADSADAVGDRKARYPMSFRKCMLGKSMEWMPS